MTTKKLSELADIVQGYALKSELFRDDPKLMPVVRIRDFHRSHTNTFTSEKIKDDRFIVHPGCLLVSMEFELYAAIWNGPKAYLNQRVCKVEPKDDGILKKYLYHAIAGKAPLIKGTSLASGVRHFSVRDIGNIDIEFPDRNIQEEICAILDKVQQIIDARSKSIELIGQLLNASFMDMVKDDDTDLQFHVYMTDLGIAGRNKISTSSRARELPAGNYPVLTREHMARAALYVKAPEDIVTFSIDNKGLCPKGTVCILENLNAVRAVILDIDAIVPDNILAFLPNEKTNAEFIVFWILYHGISMKRNASGTQRKINELLLQNTRINCPDPSRQETFRKLARKVSAIQAKAHIHLKESISLYKSLLQITFNGELPAQIELKNYIRAGLPLKADLVPLQQIDVKMRARTGRKELYEFLAEKIKRYNNDNKLDKLEKSVSNVLEAINDPAGRPAFTKILSDNDLPAEKHEAAITALKKWFDEYDVYDHIGGRYNWDVIQNKSSNFSDCYGQYETLYKTNAFLNHSEETRLLGQLIFKDLEEESKRLDEEYEHEANKFQGSDPISKYLEQADFDENIFENSGLSVLEVIKENNIGVFSIYSLRESIIEELKFNGAAEELEHLVTEERVERLVNRMLDKFLIFEFQNQPFTFQQLQQVLSTINFQPNVYVLHNYIFSRLGEELPPLRQAYFDEQMVNAAPTAYQYLLDTMNSQIMGNAIFTPPRRLYFIFSLPNTEASDATKRA